MFSGPLTESIIARAIKNKLVEIKIHNLRDFALDKRKTVDDTPYGGGPGMILRVDIIDRALKKLRQKAKDKRLKIILLTPSGKLFNQKIAKSLSQFSHLIFLCGHYEGFDARVEKLVDEQISIGDYILTGGELPAMVIIDTIVRQIPGVVGKKESLEEESFEKNLLEYPHYTKPLIYKNKKVPEILLSGNHKEITKWREEKSREKTKKFRPDLLK